MGTALCLALAGCKTKAPPVTDLHHSGAHTSGNNQGPGSGNAVSSDSGTSIPTSDQIKDGLVASKGHPGWARDEEALKAQVVHFDYDSTVIKSDEKPKVAAVADFLKGNPSKALEIDGHCDERGTEEYNRSLGERRALALREELARLGISPERVDTFTFGRDRPVDTGRSDAAHAKNRRGEFIVLSPPTQ